MGEQFRDDVETLITDTFTTLKKKKSPADTEICEVIRFNCSRDFGAVVGVFPLFDEQKGVLCSVQAVRQLLPCKVEEYAIL